ncbi:hypothetical protein CUJ83_00800 [Methanocella sp. CWC-04]|uniref:Uncharacterized protein n=1 Tax=Methanooceanicella nereidis TaxID=2052831 RepID=A0AAP2W5M8_9EURY|nr:hypothetical protein [Methanocella sp. CWC-04]MCD1293534.1 hypothetical protein [Methanocella sp. CWC-04]
MNKYFAIFMALVMVAVLIVVGANLLMEKRAEPVESSNIIQDLGRTILSPIFTLFGSDMPDNMTSISATPAATPGITDPAQGNDTGNSDNGLINVTVTPSPTPVAGNEKIAPVVTFENPGETRNLTDSLLKSNEWDRTIDLNLYRYFNQSGDLTANITSTGILGRGFGYTISSHVITFDDNETVKPVRIMIDPESIIDDKIILQFSINESGEYVTGDHRTCNLTINIERSTPTITPLPTWPPETTYETVVIYVFKNMSGNVTGVAEVPVYVKDYKNDAVVDAGHTNATGYFVSKRLPCKEYLLEGGVGWTEFGPQAIPVQTGEAYREFQVTPP